MDNVRIFHKIKITKNIFTECVKGQESRVGEKIGKFGRRTEKKYPRLWSDKSAIYGAELYISSWSEKHLNTSVL